MTKAEITQIKISKHAKMNIMVVSDLLHILEHKELIFRKESTEDSRAKEVILTLKGISLLKHTIPIVEEFDKGFFSTLGNELKEFNINLIKLT